MALKLRNLRLFELNKDLSYIEFLNNFKQNINHDDYDKKNPTEIVWK